MDNKENNINEQPAVSPEASEKKNPVISFFKTMARWFKRMVFGGSNAFFMEIGKKNDEDVFSVEKIESPGKQRLKAFFRKKLAIGALAVFLIVFLVMLIGPLFYPLNLAYIEATQQNVAPGLNMMSVPKALRGQIKNISSTSTFSVGLSEDGNVYVWGHTKNLLTDLSEIPEEVENANIIHVAAGSDHIIAIGDDGTVYGWGNNNLAQYGKVTDPTIQVMCTEAPYNVLNGKLDPNEIKQVACGQQVSAIVMNDGTFYIWGNHSTGATNIYQVSSKTNVDKVIFSSRYAVLLMNDGTICVDGTTFEKAKVNDEKVDLLTYIEESGKRVVDIAAANNSAAFLLENGEVLVSGVVPNGEDIIPAFAEGERVVSISGGQNHYTALTDKGTVYCWGSNALKQLNVPDDLDGVAKVYTGPFQNYAVDEDGNLMEKWGLKGYLMGTDGYGRDIWSRIVNGGRLTMTVGAIAVVISSIIGIIVGCLSGYFGGWIDMLLMRIAEIVSAIPFMPFALILSLIVATMGLSEMTRIVLIMVILGVLSWPGLARLVRGQVLSEREKEFVTAAKAMGVKEYKIAFKHILPNVISIIIVSMTLDFAGCMLTESSLSYLGFGVMPPRPTWGNMLNGASNSIVIQNYWWQWLFPSIFLMITTICINIIGDALRDVMDPKSNSGR